MPQKVTVCDSVQMAYSLFNIIKDDCEYFSDIHTDKQSYRGSPILICLNVHLLNLYVKQIYSKRSHNATFLDKLVRLFILKFFD